jgi:hypothetical protein
VAAAEREIERTKKKLASVGQKRKRAVFAKRDTNVPKENEELGPVSGSNNLDASMKFASPEMTRSKPVLDTSPEESLSLLFSPS